MQRSRPDSMNGPHRNPLIIGNKTWFAVVGFGTIRPMTTVRCPSDRIEFGNDVGRGRERGNTATITWPGGLMGRSVLAICIESDYRPIKWAGIKISTLVIINLRAINDVEASASRRHHRRKASKTSLSSYASFKWQKRHVLNVFL